MTRDEMKALFLLAGFDLSGCSIFKLVNEYSGSWSIESPWWLVQTKYGLIKIGWRKRVINIDWSDTPYRVSDAKFWDGRVVGAITADDVTKDDTFVHAWGYPKALEYLTTLHLRLRQVTHRPEEDEI